jgi:ABC-type transport system substrate-binding protein
VRLWPRQTAQYQDRDRKITVYRDPAVILIDQLKTMYIDGELDTIETANWFSKIARKDYQIGLNLTGSGVDDPDQQFYENYACGSERNYTGYCNPELQKLFNRQSAEADQQKRKPLVWDIDKKLQEDVARPIIFHNRGGTCWQPRLANLPTNSRSISVPKLATSAVPRKSSNFIRSRSWWGNKSPPWSISRRSKLDRSCRKCSRSLSRCRGQCGAGSAEFPGAERPTNCPPS